jgi:diadenosine tetraphosphate (Ap4A) HIT family hydrolase
MYTVKIKMRCHILGTEVAEVNETHTHFHFLPRRRNNTAYLPLPIRYLAFGLPAEQFDEWRHPRL